MHAAISYLRLVVTGNACETITFLSDLRSLRAALCRAGTRFLRANLHIHSRRRPKASDRIHKHTSEYSTGSPKSRKFFTTKSEVKTMLIQCLQSQKKKNKAEQLRHTLKYPELSVYGIQIYYFIPPPTRRILGFNLLCI